MDRTDLGDRMKGYESQEAGRRLLPLLPICIRLDGRGFSKWTAGLERPFDVRLSQAMVATTKALVKESSAAIGYTQSDEISLVLPGRSLFFDRRIQKLSSVLAAFATACFGELVRDSIPERRGRPATFDCRVWAVPDLEEAANTLLWREVDATKNSISMATRAHYPHAELVDKSASEMQEMLHAVGVNWNDFPVFFKRGTFVQRRAFVRSFTPEELGALPPNHLARTDPDIAVTRYRIVELEMPPFGKVPAGELDYRMLIRSSCTRRATQGDRAIDRRHEEILVLRDGPEVLDVHGAQLPDGAGVRA